MLGLSPKAKGASFHQPMTFPGQHHLELAALRRELTREATEVSAEGLEETDAEEESEPSTVQLRQAVDLAKRTPTKNLGKRLARNGNKVINVIRVLSFESEKESSSWNHHWFHYLRLT